MEEFFQEAFRITGYNKDSSVFLQNANLTIILNSASRFLEDLNPEERSLLLDEMNQLQKDSPPDHQKARSILLKYISEAELESSIRQQEASYIQEYYNTVEKLLDDQKKVELKNLVDQFMENN